MHFERICAIRKSSFSDRFSNESGRLKLKIFLAFFRAEVVSLAGIFRLGRRLVLIDDFSADRVYRLHRRIVPIIL